MTLILVMDNDCAVGRGGGLLCRLPADMKNFRETTLGSTVIMGRKTYESFPVRPLPDRENLVLSRSVTELAGARVFAEIDALTEYVRTVEGKVFVIGGGDVYRQLEPYCDEALVTRLYENMGGDTFVADICRSRGWELAEASQVIETNCKRIRLFRYVRRSVNIPVKRSIPRFRRKKRGKRRSNLLYKIPTLILRGIPRRSRGIPRSRQCFPTERNDRRRQQGVKL